MNNRFLRRMLTGSVAAVMLGGSALSAIASEVEVRIVNLTRGQVFSPVIAWSHNGKFEPFFAFGAEASEELRAIAEDGNAQPLADLLSVDRFVGDIAISDPIPPGGTVTLKLDTRSGANQISLGSMLVNTNDTFFALRGVDVPRQRAEFFQPAWDAGTEDNNEDCSYIPGPACADIDPGNINDPDDGEGFIFTQEGIHGQAGGVPTSDLNPAQQDWRNPVAYVVLTR